MHPDGLDFTFIRSRLTPVGAVLLLAGILLAAGLAFEATEILAQRKVAEEKLVQVKGRLAELRGVKGAQDRASAKAVGRVDVKDDREARRISDAQAVIRALTAPWNEVFNALEGVQDDTVALLSLTPEMSAGRISFTGEAKNYEALTSYLARLDEGGVLAHAQLLAHEVKGNDRNVVFSASASFRK